MKVLGFITEYNPFHNGHKYHLQASKTITGATHT
ncbi:MAG: nucleotidyltransferase family protein, partial [Thermotaleaceae bacterium]